MHFPLPAASGAQHPVTAYYDGMRRHWGPLRRAAAQLVRAGHAAAALASLRRYSEPGTRLRDLRTCLRYGLLPRELAWARDVDLEPSLDLLPAHVKKGIDLLLNPNAFPLAGNLLLDKLRFDRVMRARGLPCPNTFGGDQLSQGLPGWAARADALIYKPAFNSQGRGIVRLDRIDASAWTASDTSGGTIDLLGWLRARMHDGDVVQEFLLPHPDLALRSPGALPTLRIITALDEADVPEPTDVVVRFGGGASFLDNFHRGGIAAPVDLATGRTIHAMQRDIKGRFHVVERHPTTGERVGDVPLPLFRESLAIAVQAHAVLLANVGKVISVGWDVALSDRGPILIEGNWNPGLPTLQYLAGKGLARGRLGELWVHHLRQVPRERWLALNPISHSRTARG